MIKTKDQVTTTEVAGSTMVACNNLKLDNAIIFKGVVSKIKNG